MRGQPGFRSILAGARRRERTKPLTREDLERWARAIERHQGGFYSPTEDELRFWDRLFTAIERWEARREKTEGGKAD